MTPDIARLRELANKRTQGEWAITTYAGGLSFGGLKQIYCGTDPEYGEPRKIPSTDADKEYIVAACNALPGLLDELERLEDALSDIEDLADHKEYTLDDMCYQILHIARQALQGGAVND